MTNENRIRKMLNEEMLAKNKRLKAYLNSLPSLIDVIKSGKLRPPEKICICLNDVSYMIVDKRD